MKSADNIQELDDVAVQCRVDGHDWGRGKAVEYVWTSQRGGRPIEVEKRKHCHNCGTVSRHVYDVDNRNGQFVLKDVRYSYPKDLPYLVKLDEHGNRPSRAEALFEAAVRFGGLKRK